MTDLSAVRPASPRRGPKADMNRSSLVKSLRENGASLGKIGKELGMTRQRVDQILNPMKRAARTAVRHAIRRGDLVRPERCEACGMDQISIEAHHEDYSNPLDVNWFCTFCHNDAHRKIRDARRVV